MDKKKKKHIKKMSKKKNLSIVNNGDIIVIKNRSTIAAGVLGAVVLGVCLAGLFTLEGAWSLPYFWLLACVLAAATLYSLTKVMLSKIILDSPKMLMTVYNPFKKEYKFEDINYVDVKTAKGGEGVILHVVVVYIGVGKRTVEMVSYSKEQADQLASLLRGMLDNGAMIFPEGDEEPFHFEDDKREFNFIKRRKKNKDSEDGNEKDEEKENEREGKNENGNKENEI